MNRSELLEKLARELDEWPTPDTLQPLLGGYGKCGWQVTGNGNKELILKNYYEKDSRTALFSITKQQWLDEKNRLEKIDNQHVILSRDEMLLKLAQNTVEWKDKGTPSDEELYRWGWEWGVTMESPDLVLSRDDGSEIITARQWLTKIDNLKQLKNLAFSNQHTPNDTVNHTGHYTQGRVECIDAIESATINKSGSEAVCTGNVIKYLWRYESKNGVEDVKKARWYLERLIKELEK